MELRGYVFPPWAQNLAIGMTLFPLVLVAVGALYNYGVSGYVSVHFRFNNLPPPPSHYPFLRREP